MIRSCKTIEEVIKERILILDGAMGTMIQAYHLTEDDFRGADFKLAEGQMKGNNDMQDGIRGGISHPCFTQTVYKITGRLLPPHRVFIAIAIDPHRRRATNGNGHNEQIKQRDHRKQAG